MSISAAELESTDQTGNIFLDSLINDTAFDPGFTIVYVLQGEPGGAAFGGDLWAAEGRRAAVAAALDTWEAVANIHFVEAAGPYNGTGSTAAYDWIESLEALEENTLGVHSLPHTGVMTGTFQTADDFFTAENLGIGGLAFSTLVHEFGHGLGLLHPHNDDGDPPNDPHFPGVDDPFDNGDNSLNQGPYTVMSYNGGISAIGISPDSSFGYEAGPGAFDIAAVQSIYGANMTTATGANTYTLPGLNQIGTGWRCIWDAGGNDTISAAGLGLDCIIDLTAATLLNEPGGGGFLSRAGGVLGGWTIANGVVIENATGGSGDDLISGNSASNVLNGGAGIDTVSFSKATGNLTINLSTGTATGAGTDTLTSFENAIGGSGNDIITAAAGLSVTIGAADSIKLASQNIGSMNSAMNLDYRFSNHSGDVTIDADPGMESATVHASGSGAHDFYTFYISSPGTVIVDIDNAFGIDTVVKLYDQNGTLLATNDDGNPFDTGSAFIYDAYLEQNVASGNQMLFVEVLGFNNSNIAVGSSYTINISVDTTRIASGTELRGSTIYGGGGEDTLNGLDGIDTLYGENGNDTLDGGGNLDHLYGGSGNDTYYVNQQTDVVYEGAGQGTDLVRATGNFYLYANIENLTLQTGAGDIFGVGNTLANTIAGNEGANLLLGGDGNDTINGGTGGDQIYGEAGDDTLNGEAGVDYLIGGANNDTLNGGEDSDALYGEDGNDTLNGGTGFFTDILSAGAGNDTLYGNSGLNEQDYLDGAAGDDTYYVDTTYDLTFEAEGGGNDTVYADVSNVPNAGVYLWGGVENLILVGTTAYGVGNELANTMTGSASGNWLLGGAGNDTLNGKGGGDVLFGEAGADTFVFETGSGADVIGDFNAAEDTINLDAYNFASFAALQANFVQNGAHGAILLGGSDFIVLHNVTMASLNAGDFIL